jgi:hypothetical protein
MMLFDGEELFGFRVSVVSLGALREIQTCASLGLRKDVDDLIQRLIDAAFNATVHNDSKSIGDLSSIPCVYPSISIPPPQPAITIRPALNKIATFYWLQQQQIRTDLRSFSSEINQACRE